MPLTYIRHDYKTLSSVDVPKAWLLYNKYFPNIPYLYQKTISSSIHHFLCLCTASWVKVMICVCVLLLVFNRPITLCGEMHGRKIQAWKHELQYIKKLKYEKNNRNRRLMKIGDTLDAKKNHLESREWGLKRS